MIARIRRWWHRRRPADPASLAAFSAATRDDFAPVTAARTRMHDLLTAPPSPGRLEEIAETFDDFSRAMKAAVANGDDRQIAFLERLFGDVDARQNDRFSVLRDDIQRVALEVREVNRVVADLQQTIAYKAQADEKRFKDLEDRL